MRLNIKKKHYYGVNEQIPIHVFSDGHNNPKLSPNYLIINQKNTPTSNQTNQPHAPNKKNNQEKK